MPDDPLRLALHGASGRMGRGLVRLLERRGDFRLVAALVGPGSGALGRDVGELAGLGSRGLACSSDLAAVGEADVLLDFSTPAALPGLLAACAAHGIPVASGTTGLGAAEQGALAAAAGRVAVLWAPNMSLGVQLLYGLVGRAAAALGLAADIEIHETHHRHKRDAPSGTALALGRIAAEARGQDPGDVLRTDRTGADAPRVPGEIGLSAARLGEVVGEHSVSFGLGAERLEIVHRAGSREVFLQGALAAARFLVGRPAGRYALADVLGPEGS